MFRGLNGLSKVLINTAKTKTAPSLRGESFSCSSWAIIRNQHTSSSFIASSSSRTSLSVGESPVKRQISTSTASASSVVGGKRLGFMANEGGASMNGEGARGGGRQEVVFGMDSRRGFKSSCCGGGLCHGGNEGNPPKSEDEVVNITYVLKDGSKQEVKGKVGDNVMYLAHHYGIDIEGACEASLACSTCHVYVKEDFLDVLPEAVDEEEDMLDLAPFLEFNSRLSCQIILSKDMDGIEVTLPRATRNFYVDGHVPQPH
eukprot:Nk52_evm88s210 gene=Nk52_evmTU88s210